MPEKATRSKGGKAKQQVKLLRGITHGWKPSGKPSLLDEAMGRMHKKEHPR